MRSEYCVAVAADTFESGAAKVAVVSASSAAEIEHRLR